MPTAEQLLKEATANRTAPPPPVEDVHLGAKHPGDDDAAITKATERAAEAKDDPRIRHLEEQLREQSALIAGLLARDKDRPMNELAQETADFEAQRARQKRYDLIISDYEGLCTLQIHTHSDLNQNWDVPIYHNGTKYLLRRGVPYTVPVCVLEILDNARIRSAVKLWDGEGNVRTQIIDQLSYPYSMLSMGRGAH